MADTLVDSNVLLDVLTEDARWFAWSSEALARRAGESALVVNPIIYAEVSIGFARIEELDEALNAAGFARWPLHRRRGGARASTLPDFYIGAHAAVSSLALLTRDAARYRTYFPGLEVISP